MTEPLIPTESHTLWNGAVEVHCFGTRHGNWSLAGATPEEAEEKNPGIIKRMCQLTEQFNCMIAAPNPSRFNAEIVRPNILAKAWVSGRLYRDAFADGVVLSSKGAAFAVASADCPTGILWDTWTGVVVAAHCGFKSFFEWKPGAKDFARAARRPPVPEAMFAALARAALVDPKRYDARRVRGFFAGGVGPNGFDFHTEHPDYERAQLPFVRKWLKEHWGSALLPFGKKEWMVDLRKLFCHQLEGLCGPAREYIGFDGTCTATDIGSDGQPLWHSHRRNRNAGRNLVLVIRRA